MIGDGKGGSVDIGKYLVNFNSSDWANQANQYLQSALTQGLQYSEKYSKAAIDAAQAYQQQAQAAQQAGMERAQALQAPQRLAAYGALDAYQDVLGLSRPEAGSFQLASALENVAKQNQAGLLGQTPPPVAPQQAQMAASFQQGLLGNPQIPQGGNQ